MFIDHAKIEVTAGTGGDGVISFRKEKFVPFGGTFGGTGGEGGDVVFQADLGMRTLLDFRYQKIYKAENGEKGRTKNQHGKRAKDLIIKVPLGTAIFDAKTDELLVDLVDPNQKYTVAHGGRGGRGNTDLAKAGRHSLEICERGEPGETKELRVELKILSDVGLVGFPSVGKSTLISVISAARPKIAAYHFTTLVPNLGVVQTKDKRSFVVADLPGLIEGAHQGKGLGQQFLRHIERTKVIIHLIDMAGVDMRDPIEDYQKIRNELLSYDEKMKDKKEIVAANKMDVEGAEENLRKFREAYPELEVFPISAITKENIEILLLRTADVLDSVPIKHEIKSYKVYKFREDKKYNIHIDAEGIYVVDGPGIEKLYAMTDFSTYDNTRRLAFKLQNLGVDDELRNLGVQNGDIVRILDYEYEFQD